MQTSRQIRQAAGETGLRPIGLARCWLVAGRPMPTSSPLFDTPYPMADTPKPPSDPRLAHALELIDEAEKLTVPGDPTSLGRAAANAEGAIRVLTAFVGTTPTPEARNLLAAAWMRRGVALLVFGAEPQLVESIRCFDEALRWRQDLLATRHPALIHAHASCHFGRADALAQLGGEDNIRRALAGYDQGLGLLGSLPVREVPQLMARMIAVHGARARLLEGLRTPAGVAEAVEAHRAIAVLIRGTPGETHPEFRLHLGAALANIANLQLIAGAATFLPEQARGVAGEAIQAVDGLERENPVAGEIAIKARRTIYRAIAALIESQPPGTPSPREFLSTMTDAADEALALARHWEARGVTAFRPLAIELFGFGASLYVRHQTHFFAEFVLDNLDPEQSPDAFRNCPEMHGLATALVGDALKHFERDRVVTTDTQGIERQIETMQTLRRARERLAELAPTTPA